MAIYSIFGSAPPSGVSTGNDDGAAVNLATAFYLFGGVTGWSATGARFWLPADSNAPTTGYKAYLWAGQSWASSTQVSTVDFGTVTKGAWNEVDFASAAPLTSGSFYWVSVYFPAGCYGYKASTFSNALVSTGTPNLYGAGFTEVTPGNGAFAYGAAGISGGGSGGSTWYGVDVLVWDGDGGSGGGSGASDAADNVGITDSVSAVRSGLASSATFTGTAADPIGGTSNDSATLQVGTGSTIHAVRHTMTETSSVFGSPITPDVKGPTLASEAQGYELGICIIPDRDCRVVGARIWKHPDAAGSIPVSVWAKTGQLLGTKTVTWVADDGGYREITLDTPVQMTGLTEYRISYYAANGKFGVSQWVYNAQDYVEPPFRVIAVGDGKVGGSCIRNAGGHGFPETYWHASYWVHPTVEYDSPIPKEAPGYMQQWSNYNPSDEFPMAVFYSDPPFMADYCSIGITTFIAIPIGVPGYRDAILATGCDVWAMGGDLGEGAQYTLSDPEMAPRVKGYFLRDEPDLAGTYVKPQVIRDQIAAIRRIDSSRPNMLNFGYALAMASGWSSLQFGQSINDAAKEWVENVNMADVVSLDWYNLMPDNLQGYQGAWTYPRQIKRLQKFGNENRPVWGYVESTSGIPDNPSPAKVEAAVWGMIIAGAQGIVFFDHRFPNGTVTMDFAALLHDPPMRAKVQELCTRIKAIGGALLAGDKGYITAVSSSNITAGPLGGVFGVPIETRTVTDGTYRYLLAQASRPGTTTGTFTVPSAASKTLTVMNENRTVTANSSGVFTDSFAAEYQFHLYRWTP